MKTLRGFSLIELMIALGIAALLASLGGNVYFGYLRSAQTADALATISLMRERLTVLHVQKGEDPFDCTANVAPKRGPGKSLRGSPSRTG